MPQWVLTIFPLWIGALLLGSQGQLFLNLNELGYVLVFLTTATILIGIAEFSNTYADYGEDSLYVPSSPLVTGALSVTAARRAFILKSTVYFHRGIHNFLFHSLFWV